MNSRAGQVLKIDQMGSQVLDNDVDNIKLQAMKDVSEKPHLCMSMEVVSGKSIKSSTEKMYL